MICRSSRCKLGEGASILSETGSLTTPISSSIPIGPSQLVSSEFYGTLVPIGPMPNQMPRGMRIMINPLEQVPSILSTRSVRNICMQHNIPKSNVQLPTRDELAQVPWKVLLHAIRTCAWVVPYHLSIDS